MKINNLNMVFFLLIIFFIFSNYQIKNKTIKSHKFNENKNKTLTKKPIQLKKNIVIHENSFGKIIKEKSIIKEKPWKVTRCDQIVVTKRKMIPDHEDLTNRKSVVITITAYYINLFAENNPDKLLQSLLFSDSKKTPKMQRGARGCIRIDGGKNHHSMIICGDNKKEGRYLLSVINFFAECRASLKKPVKADFTKYKKLMRACGVNSGFKDPKVIKKRIKMIKKKRKEKKNRNKSDYYKGFYHPGFSGVPGTFR